MSLDNRIAQPWASIWVVGPEPAIWKTSYMAQVFHRSANTIARASIIGVVVVVSVLLWAALEMQRSPYATYQGVEQAAARAFQP